MNDVILCYKEPYFIMNFKNLALKNNKINKLSVLFVMEKFSNFSYFAHLIH
ncbi:uncharacterized protein LMUH8_2534 [Listeria monocytogenes]|uniref:Uncharacterized protein n=1 Tax=Listeria monocytogenes TaxID=1639 RepID=A0AB37N663_LISMN|nr:hypothetical protein L2626_02660 [Listeria monocytogenes]EXL17372.1 hypothetical protein X844_0357 [Listeria monocytogenes Lm_1823]EXL26931.1 Undefined function protein [Listeria monocytogenes Lm_1889]KFL19841.1 hypothetical protein DR89_2039 [Listeria monocytogenes FSL F6-684]RKF90948.1 hypothetical protein CFSAN002350_002643 [Listeria monocytogenes CFSAN002350]CCQ25205.1 Undefined function [Listeria monocytogenes N53-1]